MKLVVTGGAGYIGSVVTSQLLDAGHEVTAVDDLSTGHRDAVPEGADFVQARIHEAADFPRRRRGAALRGQSLVGESVERPELYWENNVVGSYALLEAVRAAGIPRFRLLLDGGLLRRAVGLHHRGRDAGADQPLRAQQVRRRPDAHGLLRGARPRGDLAALLQRRRGARALR